MKTSKTKNTIYILLAIVVLAFGSSGFLRGSETDSPAEDVVLVNSSSGESVFEQAEASAYENYHWGNHKTLQDHFDRHGGDFNAADPQDYARMAHELYLNRENYQVKLDEDGVVRIYDPKTNAFGAYNKNGSTRSFFKPSGGQGYFDRQPGKLED